MHSMGVSGWCGRKCCMPIPTLHVEVASAGPGCMACLPSWCMYDKPTALFLPSAAAPAAVVSPCQWPAVHPDIHMGAWHNVAPMIATMPDVYTPCLGPLPLLLTTGVMAIMAT